MSTANIIPASNIVIEGLRANLKTISSTVFKEYPSLTSFGWKQFINHDGEFVTTITTPDIDFEHGADIFDAEDRKKQEFIFNKLKKLNPVALQLAFDENAEITIDSDLDFTRTDYDINRIVPYEL